MRDADNLTFCRLFTDLVVKRRPLGRFVRFNKSIFPLLSNLAVPSPLCASDLLIDHSDLTPYIMPVQDASNRRRGRKATRFIFSDEQRKVIESYIPAFEEAVHNFNPGLTKSNDKISKWKTATAETIMQHDLFQDIEENSSETRKRWFAVSVHGSCSRLITET